MNDVRKHCEFGGLAGPVADTTQRLRTAWDFACEWYRTEQCIAASMSYTVHTFRRT